MTPAARRSLISVARKCAAERNWTPLCGWAENYAERTRSSLDRAPDVETRPHLPAITTGWWRRNRAAVVALGVVAAVFVGGFLARMP